MKSERMFYARNKSIRIILSLLFFFICFSVFPQSGEKFATNGNNLSHGNLLTVKKITSPSGTVDFGDNHLTTTGTITANNINVTNYSNPSFSGSGSGIITYDNNGVFQKLSFNNDANTVLLGNGTFSLFPTIGW